MLVYVLSGKCCGNIPQGNGPLGYETKGWRGVSDDRDFCDSKCPILILSILFVIFSFQTINAKQVSFRAVRTF